MTVNGESLWTDPAASDSFFYLVQKVNTDMGADL